MTEPWVLATSCAAPDREFASIDTLAAAIVGHRDALPAPRPEFAFRPCALSRGGLPELRCLAVRLLDGACRGHGSLVGYVLFPPRLTGFAATPGRLADAVDRILGRRVAA